MPGIWGSGLDGLLRGLHRGVTGSTGPFPIAAIEEEMARRGKTLDFNATLIDDLLNTPYRHARTFALLTLMYETVDTLSRFHIDHVFPRALATEAKLKVAGLSEPDALQIHDQVDLLPNLQLLHGPVNLDKHARLPAFWAATRYPAEGQRNAWLAESDLLGLPQSFTGFLAFFDHRRELMRNRLDRLLDPAGVERSAIAYPPVRPADGSTDTEPAPPPQPAYAAGRPQGMSRSTDNGRRTRPTDKLEDLLADGRLGIGEVLHTHFFGRRYEAVVEPGGLRLDGETYTSPSAAAGAVTNGVPVNGWAFWKTEAGTPIAALRRR